MRKFFALIAIATISACGGSGGSGAPSLPSSTSSPVATPSGGGSSSDYVKPSFTITVPARTATSTRPGDVSSGTLSISIELTADSAGVTPGSLTGNPAVSNISSGTCSSGCTVSGPPSPAGTDSYTLTTYSGTNATGSALDTSSGTYTIAQGVNNAESVTLEGVPASFTFAALPTTWAAGASNSTTIGLTVKDASGATITGTYANPVTVTDNDLNTDGTHVASTCPIAQTPNTPTGPATSVTFASSSSSNTFCYLGLAESQITLTASASGATNETTTFSPVISAPTSGATTGAFVGTDAQLDTTTGTGSTGTIAYTETGFTNAPYDQVLSVATAAETCSTGGPLSTFATALHSTSGSTTVFTVTSASPYTPGTCTIPVWDGIGAYTPPTFTASYTTSGFTVDKHGRP